MENIKIAIGWRNQRGGRISLWSFVKELSFHRLDYLLEN